MFYIRPQTADDDLIIAEVTRHAFDASDYGHSNEAGIIDALRAAGALSLSLVACHGNALVGQITLSPVRLSSGEPGWYGLGPLSVIPDWRDMGVGRALVGEALGELQALGAAGCVLVGDPAYYAKLGFVAAAPLEYEGVPPEYFQVFLLTAAQAPAAKVQYHPAFYS